MKTRLSFSGIAVLTFSCCLALILNARPAFAMHISEGILPMSWAILWTLVCIPFLFLGLRDLRKRSQFSLQFKPLVGLVGAAVFVFSCMPVPVPTAGTCSHPVGTGLAAIIIGPHLAVVITSVALLLQALFLAHGGLTTLGADICTMGVAGAFAGYGVYTISRRFGLSPVIAAFGAGLAADWATYLGTSIVLALGLHGDASFMSMLMTIVAAFIPTQLPLGILEGVVTASACRFVWTRRPEFGVVTKEA